VLLCVADCSPPRNEIYFLALVDILTHYGVKKRTAQAAKTVKHGAGAEISTVRPDQYAKRFLEFVEKIIVESEEPKNWFVCVSTRGGRFSTIENLTDGCQCCQLFQFCHVMHMHNIAYTVVQYVSVSFTTVMWKMSGTIVRDCSIVHMSLAVLSGHRVCENIHVKQIWSYVAYTAQRRVSNLYGAVMWADIHPSQLCHFQRVLGD